VADGSTGLAGAAAHEGFLRYRQQRWLKVAIILSLVSLLAYGLIDVEPRHNGGSWLGYTLGTIGFGLIMWLTMLGIRKRAITPGRWSLKAWTSAHVYLGLALIVVGTLHTGFQFGWNVHTLAYVLMMLVILSGIYGVIAYVRLPKALSDARDEMTSPQMLEALAAVDREIGAAALALPDADGAIVARALAQDPLGGLLRRLARRPFFCATARAMKRLGAHQDEVHRGVVDLLAKRREALARLHGHARRRAQLEAWLFVHVPVTLALIAALIAHVVSVFFYW
jgi:hypothetical protein